LSATDTATGTLTATQAGITVNPAPPRPDHSSPVTAGDHGTATLTGQRAPGQEATGYTGTVHFTSSDSQAALPANYTFTSSDAGRHPFSATLKTVGSQSLSATDMATGTLTATQSGITVNPAPPRPDHVVVVVEENHGYADLI